jgi:sigma-E factor negative regulatory protein RseC
VETLVEEGTVEAVEGGTLVVRVRRQAACSACAARGACLAFGPTERVVRVDQAREPARPGDRVTLEIRSVTFLRATILGYLVPTLAFLAGAGTVLVLVAEGQRVLGVGRDVAAFAAGIAGVAATFAGLGIAGSRPEARRRYAPKVVAVHPAEGP